MSSFAGPIRAGRAFVELFADDSKLVSGLRRAQNTLKAWGQDLFRSGLAITAFGSSLSAPFILSTKTFTEMGDSLSAMSQRTGFATQTLSGLELAAMFTDFSMQGLENALKRMQRTLVAAMTGTKEISKAFGFLNLKTEEFVNKSPEEQLALIASRLSKIDDPTIRVAAAMGIFGREATGILPMLKDGARGLQAYMDKAKQFNIIPPQAAVDAGDKLKDVFEIIKLQVRTIRFWIGAGLEKALKPLSERLVRILARVIDWTAANGALFISIAKIAAGVVILGGSIMGLGISLLVLSKVGAGLLVVVKIIHSVLSAALGIIALLTTNLGMMTAALLVGTVALLYFSGRGGAAVSWLGAKFKTMGSIFMGTMQGIKDALLGGDLSLAAKILWLGLKAEWVIATGTLLEIWDTFKTKLFQGLRGLWDGIRAVWTIGAESLREGLTLGLRTILDVASRFAYLFKKTMADALGFQKKLEIKVGADIARTSVKSDLANAELQFEKVKEAADKHYAALRERDEAARDLREAPYAPGGENRLKRMRLKHAEAELAENPLMTDKLRKKGFKVDPNLNRALQQAAKQVAAAKERVNAIDAMEKNALEKVDEDLVGEKADLGKEFLNRQKEIFDDSAAVLEELNRKYVKDMAAIGADNKSFNDDLEAAHQEVVKNVDNETAEALKKLQRAEIDAQWARSDSEFEKMDIGDISKGIPNDLDDVMSDLDSRGGSIAGTFTNALLLGRGGGGSSQERTAKATEKTVNLLEVIKEKITKSPEATFGN